MGHYLPKDSSQIVLDKLNKLVKLVDEEKTLIENLEQNLDAMRDPTKVEETTNKKLIDKDVEMVSNMTKTLVLSNDFARNSCKTLINSVHSMIKSATNIKEIGSKQPISMNTLTDQHDDSASSNFEYFLDYHIALLKSIRDDNTQRNGNVNLGLVERDSPFDINTPDPDLKAVVQGQDERLIKERQASLNVNSLMGPSNSKDKSDFIEPSMGQVILYNEALEKQNARQSTCRENVKTLKTLCVNELMIQFRRHKLAKIEIDRQKDRIKELTDRKDKKKDKQTNRNVQLQLYCKQNDYLTEEIVKEMLPLLIWRMESYGVDIGVIQCHETSQIKAIIPSLVLCISTNGHEINVNGALRGIKRTKQTALLVFSYLDKKDALTRNYDAAAQDVGGTFTFALLKNKQKRFYVDFNSKVLGRICEFIKYHMPIHLQLYHKRNDKLMNNVVEELEWKLRCQMESVDVAIDTMQCSNASELKPDIPVLVLCISTSIVGTDVDSALTDIKRTKQTALVVFHHKDKHVKIMRTSDQVTGIDLEGIFDFAFLQNKGIYTSDLNTKALESLRDFITKQRE